MPGKAPTPQGLSEKAVDAACKAIGGVGEDGLLLIERIYDAGLLK